jgi:hypothetical protein
MIYAPGKLTFRKQFQVQDYMWEFPQQYGLWSPAQISTALWLDAADASTVATVSGAVSQWNDKSGNSRHATQVNATNRAILVNAALNGLAGIDYDGIDDDHVLANVAGLNSVNQSFFIVASRDNAAGRVEISFAIGSTLAGDGIADIPRWTDNVMYSQSGYANNRPTPTSVITDAPYINCVTGGTVQLSYTNDTLIGTGTTQSTSPFSVTGGYIGSGRAVSNSIQHFDGKIHELVIVPSVATTVLRQTMHGYLAHKWGLTANLPASHPYKTTPPLIP